ncbi:hypothetical protein T265_10362 [Opisthorchis viverrini]|uniref:Vesicle transport protein n=1 Tax=Opisthorchis viverrini TaxID=6198 RepID=A0A074Z2J7_OPIVI|nr:hypothetical protein T265_10362 [Opisthorchis viverrini]KER21281.1 hypothetical protein T265_10362 [Opisthorchis viverrini]
MRILALAGMLPRSENIKSSATPFSLVSFGRGRNFIVGEYNGNSSETFVGGERVIFKLEHSHQRIRNMFCPGDLWLYPNSNISQGSIFLWLPKGLILFALFYTIGNILSLGSTIFLMGPMNQLRRMFQETRIFAAVIMLICMAMTICAAVWWKNKLLCLIFCILQSGALTWYSLSYIPFARCSTLSVPNCHATKRKHEGWDTARLPKPRQGKSRGGGTFRSANSRSNHLGYLALRSSHAGRCESLLHINDRLMMLNLSPYIPSEADTVLTLSATYYHTDS